MRFKNLKTKKHFLADKVLEITVLPQIRETLSVGVTDICYDFSVDDLHPMEREELTKGKKTELRKAELLTGRLLQKDLISRNKMNPREFYIKKDPGGKPIGYYQGKKYGVAISHTLSVVAGALYLEGEVGLDIERKNRKIHEGLRKRILSEQEHDLLKDYDTIQIWTLKEAIVKLTGTGLRKNMRDILVKPVQNGRFESMVSGKKIDLYSFDLKDIWLTVSLFEGD